MPLPHSTKNILLVIGFLVVGTGGYLMGSQTKDFQKTVSFENEDVWVEISPIQCGGNPWELDWTQNHPNETYPETDGNKDAIIVAYYQKTVDVDVKEVKRTSFVRATCLACSCPAGYTLSLRVDDDDVKKILELGFKEKEN